MLLRVCEFLVPRHLNGFELGLVRRLRVVVEAGQGDDALAQIGEADGQRIDAGKLLRERNADVFGVLPFHRDTSSVLRSFLSDLPCSNPTVFSSPSTMKVTFGIWKTRQA